MFKSGNVVRFKNGNSPEMTVDYADNNTVGVMWFTTRDELLSTEFPAELLELVRE